MCMHRALIFDRDLFSMTNFCRATLAALSILASAPAHALDASGVWMTEDGESKIKIAPCGPKLCGTLVWLSAPNDANGQPLKDAKNADARLRGRPMIGVQLLLGLTQEGERWTGKIYNPEDGKTYDGSFGLTADGKAEIKGCVAAIFCQSDVLVRQ